MGTDEHPKASREAREAISRARHARRSTEAVAPVADDLAERVHDALEGNHFAALLEDALIIAARGRR